jgi:uncharacterized protein (TIGR03086 family)
VNTAIDPITALEQAYDDLAKVVANLDAEQLARPTNCPAWDVRGLLNHILGGALMYVLVNEGERAGEDAGDVAGDDPVGAVERTATANIASWRGRGALEGERTYPWGTFPAGAGLLINLGEVALHTWDLARATGQPAAIDRDVAELVFDFYRQVPMDDMRANGVYGPEIIVPASAPVQDRLLGFLSRQP